MESTNQKFTNQDNVRGQEGNRRGGITPLIGKQVRVAMLDDYMNSLQSLYADCKTTTVYTLISSDDHGIFLALGTDVNAPVNSSFFVPWIALSAIIPASFLHAQGAAA